MQQKQKQKRIHNKIYYNIKWHKQLMPGWVALGHLLQHSAWQRNRPILEEIDK